MLGLSPPVIASDRRTSKDNRARVNQITVDTYGHLIPGPIAPPPTSQMTCRRNRMHPRNRRQLVDLLARQNKMFTTRVVGGFRFIGVTISAARGQHPIAYSSKRAIASHGADDKIPLRPSAQLLSDRIERPLRRKVDDVLLATARRGVAGPGANHPSSWRYAAGGEPHRRAGEHDASRPRHWWKSMSRTS